MSKNTGKLPAAKGSGIKPVTGSSSTTSLGAQKRATQTKGGVKPR